MTSLEPHKPDQRSRHPYNRCQRLVAVCVGLLPFRHFSEAIMTAIVSMALGTQGMRPGGRGGRQGGRSGRDVEVRI